MILVLKGVNEISLNIDKCAVVNFSRKRPDNTSYNIGEKEVTQQHNYKYLGVVLNEKLSWDQNVEHTRKKAGRSLEFVMRNLKGTDSKIKARAYETLIRPILEYGTKVGDPYRQGLIGDLEMIQRKAARRVLNQYHNYNPEGEYRSVSKMITDIGWKSLESRRELDRLCGMHKAVNRHTGWEEIADRLAFSGRIGRGDNSKKLTINHVSTDVGKYSFINRTAKSWNKLDDTVVLSKSCRLFRARASQWIENRVSKQV